MGPCLLDWLSSQIFCTEGRMSEGRKPSKYKITERRKFPRYRVAIETTVAARSIGDATEYGFVTSNISTGGIHIKGDKNDYPFTAQTILEVWLTLSPEVKIFFNGKIMHTNLGGYGIKIVQIEDQDQAKLDDFIDKYSAANPAAAEDK